MIAARTSRGTASLVACERLAAAGAPIVSPVAQARLSSIVATARAIPDRSADSVMIDIAGIV
jgi:hypothetical protein